MFLPTGGDSYKRVNFSVLGNCMLEPVETNDSIEVEKTPCEAQEVIKNRDEVRKYGSILDCEMGIVESSDFRIFMEEEAHEERNYVAPVCIHCDSQAAIGRARSMMYNGKSRHIRRRHNTVKELLTSVIITLDYVKSKDNVPDSLTKGLSREGVERTSKGMGLRPRTSQHGGKMTSDSQIQDAATFVGATNITTSSRTNAPPTMALAEKPEKFVGIDFKLWQQKIFFYLTTLCLQRFTSEDASEVLEGTLDKERFVIVEAWKHSDFLCRNYILSGLQDDL
ncbi:hypothetical protein T459_31105 [Capsicum annuum]|uniref:Uncharacterized protein n=1 Tax=Capsicum annuum TaxID=4072 RepID=A0A2G2YAB5_CAPAN|nr:hypothetical protein T459_31105 [Capsicum annuum]